MTRKRLTDKGVEALRPQQTDYIVSDEVVPGLGVRIRPSGHKSFVFRRRLDGRDIGQLDLGEVAGMTLSAARETAHSWGALLKTGMHARVERERQHEEARR